MIRWLGAALLAVVIGIGLFVLAVSGRLPELAGVNVWMLAASPLLLWLLVFAVRSYTYGGALSHFQFLEEQAQEAEVAWSHWAKRHFAVQASCVVLPEQVSAAVIAQGSPGEPRRPGEVCRITELPVKGNERVQAALQKLFAGVGPALMALPADRDLRVTVLHDLEAEELVKLRAAWRKGWLNAVPSRSQVSANFVSERSLNWLEDGLKTPGAAIELVLVLQVNGASA
ncbi:hypothetical protein [Pseudomonas sp. GCEP-101]|uniref:hypothetical protein n=1 Tax=Pseudomonas sp. GCEP-101 TaxID=2974552 RepID=UPI00223BEBC4|nr:hypothetical protein [Pseudomonas sp. GCEP-101]